MKKHILVVEDNKKHQQGACKALGNKMLPTGFVSDLHDALYTIRGRRSELAGVLTDLYFPACNDDAHGEPAPLGLIIMAECQKLGVPCIIVTAGYHHGSKYHQAHAALREMGLLGTMVDSSGSEIEADKKNWRKGLEKLEALIARTGVG